MKSNASLPAWERIPFANLPTPIQFLSRISAELGVEIYVKRDDFTGTEWSGNKIRKLEYLTAEAKAQGATCLVTFGGLQSNHARATAAVAARLGLRCVLVLRGEKPAHPRANYLLDKLLGAEILFVTEEQYRKQGEIRAAVDSQLRAQGGKAYFIPEGGSNALGSAGYAMAWKEIETQLQAGGAGLPEAFDSVVVAHGSGGTQAGLVLGRLLSPEGILASARVVGVNVCYDKAESFRLVKEILWSAIQGSRLPLSFFSEDIEILDGFVGRGYAQNTPEELRFFLKVAREEGLILDPTYTGKAFYGIWQTVKENRAALGKRILFIHTGGLFGNFKLEDEWHEVLDA